MTNQVAPASCLVCGSALSGVYDDTTGWDQPSGAVMFTGAGAYGSTVFDPMDSRQSLTVVVCDNCLGAASTQGRVALTTTTRTVTCEHQTWTLP